MKTRLAQAIGLNSTGFNVARVLGPSVAALVIARLGVSWTFGLNALSYLAVLVGLSMIRLQEQRAVRRPGVSSLDGDRYNDLVLGQALGADPTWSEIHFGVPGGISSGEVARFLAKRDRE